LSTYTKFGDAGDQGASRAQADTQGHRLEFYSIPTGIKVYFKALLTSFSDQYTTNYNSEEVYGRMDPVQSYKSTSRTISVSIDIVSGSLEESKENIAKCGMLFNMLYPVYSSNSAGAGSIKAAPMFRVRLGNLIQTTKSNDTSSSDVETTGLLGTIGGFSYEPVVETGFYTDTPGSLYPKHVNLSFELTVQHEHGLGFEESSLKPRSKNFPYGPKPTAPGATPTYTTAPPDQEQLGILENVKNQDALQSGDINSLTQEQVDAVLDDILK